MGGWGKRQNLGSIFKIILKKLLKFENNNGTNQKKKKTVIMKNIDLESLGEVWELIFLFLSRID